MPLNDKMIISMILEEAKKVPKRCAGYRDELVNVIAEILELERNNRIQAINIQQRITDKCSATGRLVADNQSQSSKS
jgi:hypothetical protein